MSINATEHYAKALLITSLIFLLSLSVTAFGESPEDKGYEIAARSDRSDNGYGDSKVEMTMILRNAAGCWRQKSCALQHTSRHQRNRSSFPCTDSKTRQSVALSTSLEKGQENFFK